MSALDLALSAVQEARYARTDRDRQSIEAEDSRQDWTLEYAGVIGGRHTGKLPNGGLMPVEPLSNGSIALGTPLTASKGAGDTIAYGQWMPR